MNIFSQCGGNTCLWILILLLLAASVANGQNGLERALEGSCIPVLIALAYSMWKNGTLSRLLCGNSGCNCGCNN